jgi:hypothetical protein
MNKIDIIDILTFMRGGGIINFFIDILTKIIIFIDILTFIICILNLNKYQVIYEISYLKYL